MQLTWNIEMRNGDPFMPSVLKSITVKRHHQISADDYDDGIVISNDINKHVIDDGLSPGYNFRWTCYLYSIDVTFQNGRHAYKEVERCFSHTEGVAKVSEAANLNRRRPRKTLCGFFIKLYSIVSNS
ncbi:hypothetical protein V3C99_011723 [Haemonchus contortus]